MDDQNKNFLLAMVLSFLVLAGWFIAFPPEQPAPTLESDVTLNGDVLVPSTDGTQAAAPSLAANQSVSREAALAKTERIKIQTARLSGSISTKGGRIDDLHLTDYKETQEPGSDTVTLLTPADTDSPYYAVHGWAAAGGVDPKNTPNANTVWSVAGNTTLSENAPVTLVWDNGVGQVFTRVISVDENYMFSIQQSVQNNSDAPIRLTPYGIVARVGEPETIGFYILHEGVVRAQDGTLEEIDYNDMPDFEYVAAENGGTSRVDVQSNGWIGFTDKYWMTTLIAQPGQPFASVAKYSQANDIYQTDMRLPAMDVAAGASASVTTMLFAGAKEVKTIRGYQDDLGIENLVDAVDWGIFFFLTKPIFWLLEMIHGVIGNMGLSIIGLTLVIKAALFPLAYKSFVSMSKMKLLQPEMAKLKENAGDDRVKLQQEMMALYKKEKVNPASGCLPILLQIPIFFSLYKVLFVTIEMRHAPFFGWITDLSAPDPSSILNLFGLLPFDAPGPESIFAILSIGVFPILMGVTMWLQQKLNPAPTDKTQAMIFAWMPWIFMFMLGNFASGLVIYWVANNTITFTQQYIIMRSQGVKPNVLGNILGRFRKKTAE